MPVRYQRKRSKGFRLPDGVRCVTRPGKWGNPFKTAIEFRVALSLFVDDSGLNRLRSLTAEQNRKMRWIADHIEELRGQDLACFCPLDVACHADILIQFANR